MPTVLKKRKEFEHYLLSEISSSKVYFADTTSKIKVFIDLLQQSLKDYSVSTNRLADSEKKASIQNGVFINFLALINYDLVKTTYQLNDEIENAINQLFAYEKQYALDLTKAKRFLSQCIIQVITNKDSRTIRLSLDEKKAIGEGIMRLSHSKTDTLNGIDPQLIVEAFLKKPQDNHAINDYIKAVEYCLAHDDSVKKNNLLSQQFSELLQILNANDNAEDVLNNFETTIQLLDYKNATQIYLNKLINKKDPDPSGLRSTKIQTLKRLNESINNVSATDSFTRKKLANSVFLALLKLPSGRTLTEHPDSDLITFVKTISIIAATILGFGVGGYFAYRTLFSKNDKNFLHSNNFSIDRKIKTAKRIINHSTWMSHSFR